MKATKRTIIISILSVIAVASAVGTAFYMKIFPFSQPTETVGLIVWQKSGSVVGSSELHSALQYLEENPDSPIRLSIIDDEWDPKLTQGAFAAAVAQGTHIFVSSHPSKCAVTIMDQFSCADNFIINTSSTSVALSGRDDCSFRVVVDADVESTAIAKYINTLKGTRLLILKDTSNRAYTDPAFRAMSRELSAANKWDVVMHELQVNDFAPDELDSLMDGAYDAMYVMAGSYQTSIGNIAQFFHLHHPHAPIIISPWARSPAILESAGAALGNIVIPSQYPSKHAETPLKNYMRTFVKRFGYEPSSMAIGIRISMELLDSAFATGCKTPADLHDYFLSKTNHTTSLGTISFNKYGDVVHDFYFITDLKHEFE